LISKIEDKALGFGERESKEKKKKKNKEEGSRLLPKWSVKRRLREK
jgi:hypothetical protein